MQLLSVTGFSIVRALQKVKWIEMWCFLKGKLPSTGKDTRGMWKRQKYRGTKTDNDNDNDSDNDNDRKEWKGNPFCYRVALQLLRFVRLRRDKITNSDFNLNEKEVILRESCAFDVVQSSYKTIPERISSLPTVMQTILYLDRNIYVSVSINRESVQVFS